MLGVVRDRTNLYLSFRQSFYRAPKRSVDYETEEHEGLISKGDTVIEMDRLPPFWVDISEDVNETLKEIQIKGTALGKLHAKLLLPSFEDRNNEEREVEKLTLEITKVLKRICLTIVIWEDTWSAWGD